MGKGTYGCVKWLLTVFNFLFLVCGLAACGLAVWMLVSPSTVSDSIGRNLTPLLSYIMLGIGGTIIIVSFCGCAGAGLENRCLLCLFFTVLCGIFVACLVASILVALFKRELETITNERLLKNLETMYGVNDAWTDFWDQMQTRFSCCGVGNGSPFVVFQNTEWYKKNNPIKLPASCCIKTPIGESRCQSANSKGYHSSGCVSAIKAELVARPTAAIVFLISLALVLILGMVLSLTHLRNIINRKYCDYVQPI